MSESKAENKGLKFDLAKALEPSEDSVHEPVDERPTPAIIMSPVTNGSNKDAIVEQDTEQKDKEDDQNDNDQSAP